MNRREAAHAIREGKRLEVTFTPETHGIVQAFIVMVYHTDVCDFPRERLHHHATIGPIHCLFWSGGHPHWLHITPKQLLGFIRRNFPRK